MDLSFLKDIGVHVDSNVPLSQYTTFQLGGPCPHVVSCSTPDQIRNTTQELNEHNILFILIGGGSNLLFSEEGLDCVVVRFSTAQQDIQQEENNLIVSAGMRLDDVVQYAVDHSLEGINFLSGIPGTVGGAIVGNAGAFGKQIGDVVHSVTLLSRKGQINKVMPEALGFRYRYSALKDTGDIALSAHLSLKSGNRDALLKERDEILKKRYQKHPDLKEYPSAGSFFRNIEPTSSNEKRQAAGWFLEQAGAKDLRVNGACVFQKHANIIIKSGDCTAQDVYDLSQKMHKAVHNKFGISLVREVRLGGIFKNMPEDIDSMIW